MTLIIATEGDSFVIVCSDSLGTYGGLSGTNVCVESRKYFKITNHVVILIAGEGDVSYQLIEDFKQSLHGRTIDGATNIAKEFINFGRQKFENLKNFPIPNPDSLFPGCVFIIAGLDKQDDVYKIPKSYVTMSYDNFLLRGDNLGYKIEGKPMIARYLFKKYYKSDMSVDDLASLSIGTLYDVSEVANDGAVGGEIEEIKLAKITSEGITLFKEQEKENFKTQWIERTHSS